MLRSRFWSAPLHDSGFMDPGRKSSVFDCFQFSYASKHALNVVQLTVEMSIFFKKDKDLTKLCARIDIDR